MIYEKPNLITDSIIQKIMNDHPIHYYSIHNKAKIGNLICFGSIVLIFIFLIYKNIAKRNRIKDNNLKQLYEKQLPEKQLYEKQLYEKQLYEQNQNYIQPSQNLQKPQPYLNINETFSQQQSDNPPLNNNNNDQFIQHNNNDLLIKPNNPNINNVIKNDRLTNNFEVKETQYPNINYVNNMDINKTNPIDLISMNNSPDKKDLTYDDIEQLRNQQDKDIQNNLNNTDTPDIRTNINYNNKKDNRPFNKQINNIDTIKNEIKQEQELYESQLDSSNLTNDSLSFSFI